MPDLPDVDEIFDGKLPEDDVTPEQFEASVDYLRAFTQINPEEVHNLDDLARVTRDIGLSIKRITLSCGEIQETPFTFKDPKITKRGNDLIAAGDYELGKNVRDKADRPLVDKTMIIRTHKTDGSSTITSVGNKSIVNWYSEAQLVTNDIVRGNEQKTNYYATLPVNVDTDRMKSPMSVFAVDFTGGRPKDYYPLMEAASEKDIQGYVQIAQRLSTDILEHLEEKKFI